MSHIRRTAAACSAAVVATSQRCHEGGKNGFRLGAISIFPWSKRESIAPYCKAS